MKQKIKIITAIDMIFLFTLCVAGFASGVIGDIIYYLAFIIPIAIGMYFIYSRAESSHGQGDAVKTNIKNILCEFGVKKRGLLISLPVYFPAIAIILFLSLLTSYVLGIFGYENTSSFDEPFYIAVLLHALLPAILEELLFRFIPMKLLSEKNKTAVLLSALMFSFAHTNLFQIPYAFAAGLIFSTLFLITKSIVPSVILHFLNNFISLLSIYGYFDKFIIPIISSLAIISIIPLCIYKKTYISAVKNVFVKEKIELSYTPLIFILLSLFLSVSALFV